MAENMNFAESCFIIMPYGVCEIAGKSIDFNWVFESIFKPASKMMLESGRYMKAQRADKQLRAGALRTRMTILGLKSRLALADITGNNPNVHNELSLRLFLKRASTAIVKQPGTDIPHNLLDDIVVDYEYARRSKKKRQESIREIREFLKQSLPPLGTGLPEAEIDRLINNWGTPAQTSKLAMSITAAEQAVAAGNLTSAISRYRKINETLPDNPVVMMRLGGLLTERPSLKSKQDAAAIFSQVASRCESYSDAHLNQGLAENTVYVMQDRALGVPTGKSALLKAQKLGGTNLRTTQVLASIHKDQGLFDQSKTLYKPDVLTNPAARRDVTAINHMLGGGSEFEIGPMYRSRDEDTYSFTVRNLPADTPRHEVARTLSPYGINRVRMQPIADSGRVNAVGHFTISDPTRIDALSSTLDGTSIHGSSLIMNTTKVSGGGNRGSGGGYGGAFGR